MLKVLRTFFMDGIKRTNGEILQNTSFRNLEAAKRSRYVTDYVGDSIKCECGREFETDVLKDLCNTCEQKKSTSAVVTEDEKPETKTRNRTVR